MASTRAAPAGPSGSDSRRSPTKWLSAYDDFITKNLGQVSQIESTLRSLTYIIPGRFRDAEIASEAIHSGVQLLSLYHDLVLLRIPSAVGTAATTPASPSSSSSSTHNAARSSISSKPPLGPAHSPDQHTRYTRYWTYKSPFYRRVAIVLQVVRYTEMLCEMAAKRRGERIRWRVVVIIEAIKALCQLLLFRITRGRTLVTPVLPVRQPLPGPDEDEQEDEDDGADEEYQEHQEHEAEDEDAVEDHRPSDAFAEAAVASEGIDAKPNTSLISPQPPLSPPPSPLRTPAEPVASASLPPSPPATERQSTPSHPPSPSAHTKGWSMPRTGMSLPPLPHPGDISSYLLSRVLTADDIKPATKLLNQLRGSAQVAEILHILTPLVFAVALARTREKRRTSWTPWLAGLAMECAARQLRDHSLRTTTLEREEWTRRGRSMGWWSMRGAFYEHIMKGVVGGARARLPNFIGGIVEDYEYLWESYYFSTSP